MAPVAGNRNGPSSCRAHRAWNCGLLNSQTARLIEHSSPRPPRRIRYNGRVTEHLHRDWILYAVAAAAAVAIASGLLFYNWWYSVCSAVAAIGGC